MVVLSRPIITGAQEAQRQWKVPACVGLAQCIDESDGFVRMPLGSNNGLGIKALHGLPSIPTKTYEEIRGQRVGITAHFAQFESIAQCFYYWGKLLATNPVYRDAMAEVGNWQLFVAKMAPHYATDHLYGSKIVHLVQENKLDQYNV